MSNPIDIAAQACGGLSKLAGAIGVSVQAASNWRERGIPLHMCAAVESASNGAVTRQQMRPTDWHRIWPELAQAAA